MNNVPVQWPVRFMLILNAVLVFLEILVFIHMHVAGAYLDEKFLSWAPNYIILIEGIILVGAQAYPISLLSYFVIRRYPLKIILAPALTAFACITFWLIIVKGEEYLHIETVGTLVDIWIVSAVITKVIGLVYSVWLYYKLESAAAKK